MAEPAPTGNGATLRVLAFAGWALVALLLAFLWMQPEEKPAWPSYADTYDAVARSVVGVSLNDPERRLGSGFAVSPTRVVTARHLVIGADEVAVHTLDGSSWPAKVVGTDARTDLALVEAPAASFSPVVLGRSADLRVGDTVLAIGNPFGLGHSLAIGTVGHLERRLDAGSPGPEVDFLQLTLPLNPGNSGGPVFDERGNVVAVLSGTHAQGQAIAFAVPAEALIQALPALEQGEQLSRAFLGARTESLGGAVEVTSVVPAGPADRAGILVGDRITSIDGQPIGSPDALHAILDHLSAGTTARIGLDRGDTHISAEVELSDWAAHPMVVAGMTLRPAPGAGGEVVAVRPRSRAEQAGVRIGDVVRAVDGAPMRAPADVQQALWGPALGQIELVRDGQSVVLQLPAPG